MNKNALRFLVASALLSPATLYALGLGEIRLNSALNQPFDAEIEVVSASTDEMGSLKVAFASEEMFRRYGLDRPNFLSNFSLRVDSANAGRPVIKLRSPNAVTEPFLSLLVEVSWTGGRMLREYTVLLDPPVFAPAATQPQVLAPRGRTETPVASGNIERAAPAATPAPAAAPSPAPVAEPVAAAVATSGSYTVKRADTLSKIANAINAGGSSASARQTMVALYRANPQAFDGNMNVLRAGSVLRIPASADIAAISSAEATTELVRQNGAWRGANAGTVTGAEPAARLRLVPAEQGGAGGSNTAGAAATANNERVKALEAELAEARRLLDLRNAELAQMQLRLAGTSGMAATPAPVSPPVQAASSSVSSVEAAASSAAAEPAATEPVAEQVEQQSAASSVASKPSVAKAVPPAETAPTLFEQLSKYGIAVAGLGVALIAGLLIYRRRQQAAEADDSSPTLTARDFEDHLLRTAARNRPFEDAEANIDTDEHQVLDIGQRAAAYAAPAAPIELSEDTLSSETAIHVDQQDALAEADFHMAYGLYDQAADIVKLAVERQPERRDLKLKLAEIFFVWGNKDAFLEVAQQLHASQDEAAPGEWDKVLIMGKQICPEEPLFAGDIAGSRSADSVDVNLEGGEHHVDIDLYDAPAGDQPRPDVDFELASTGAHIGALDSGLDFLLDEPRRGVDDEPTREFDANARTQETPTIESPYLPEQGSVTIREKLDRHLFDSNERNIEQTAELSLDEIGLNVDELEQTGTVESEADDQLGDDELTRLAPTDFDSHAHIDASSETKTMLAPQFDEDMSDLDEDGSGGNTITVEQIDLDVNDTAEQLRPAIDSTGIFNATQKLDVDLDSFDLNSLGDTVEQPRPDGSETGIFRATQKIDVDLDYLADRTGVGYEGETLKVAADNSTDSGIFSEDVFGSIDDAEQTLTSRELNDTNVTELNPTELMNGEYDLSEMEPATMSEVGTKLDLARAYMDMGDPDGARSILQEVLEEGSVGQKQEAQRLLDSIG